jgi:hypothetical protein
LEENFSSTLYEICPLKCSIQEETSSGNYSSGAMGLDYKILQDIHNLSSIVSGNCKNSLLV